MYKEVLHFLRFMPLRYFISGGLWSGPVPTLAFYISPNDVRLLLMRGKRTVGYEPNLLAEADLPPRPEGSGDSKSVQVHQLLSPKLARRYGLSSDVEHLFIVDCSLKDIYFQLSTLHALKRRTPDSLLEDLQEDPNRILAEWNDHRPYRWTVLANDFRPEPLLKAGLDDQIIIVGLPEDYCEQLESWTASQGATISAIVPLPVAAYAFLSQVILRKETRTGIGIVVSDSLAMSAVMRDGKVDLIHLSEDLPSALQAVPQIVSELRLSQFFVFVWASGEQLAEVELPPEAIALDSEQLRTIAGSLSVAESHGKKITHDEPVAHLLAWAGQL